MPYVVKRIENTWLAAITTEENLWSRICVSHSNRKHLPLTFRIYKVSRKTNIEIIDGIEVNFVEMQMLYTDHTLPCLANFYVCFLLFSCCFSLRELK